MARVTESNDARIRETTPTDPPPPPELLWEPELEGLGGALATV